MAYVPSSDSVIAFQSPGSLLTTIQKAGSILAVSGSFSPSGNQSVSGAVTAPPGSVMMTAQLAGSVMAVSGSFSPSGNQSVSGAITAPAGSVMNVVNPAGSITAVTTVFKDSSILAFQLAGSVMAVSATLTPPANQSVSGEVNVIQTTSPWLVNAGGSIIAVLQGSSIIARVTGSVATLGIAGSIASVTNPAGSITQVAGATTTTAGSIISATTPAGSVLQVRTDLASVLTVQPAGSVMNVNISGSVATVGTAAANQSVSGAITTPPGSITTVAQVAGSILSVTVRSGSVISNAPAGSILAVTVVSGSTLAFAPAGSLMAVVVNAGSIIANQAAGSLMTVINPAGSITATTATLLAPSIVGTYAEDAGHTTADKGIFTLGVRNDSLSNITSADLDYGSFNIDADGRMIIKPFVPEGGSVITYNGSVTSTSVTLIQASLTGIKSYITDFWVANSGATTTIVQFMENGTSVIGTTIAPAGGGSNSPGIAIPIKTKNTALDLGFKALSATSILYVTVKGYQSP